MGETVTKLLRSYSLAFIASAIPRHNRSCRFGLASRTFPVCSWSIWQLRRLCSHAQ